MDASISRAGEPGQGQLHEGEAMGPKELKRKGLLQNTRRTHTGHNAVLAPSLLRSAFLPAEDPANSFARRSQR